MGQEEEWQPLQLFSPHVWDPRVVPQLAGFAPKLYCYLTLPPCCISCWSQLDSQPSRILLHSTAQPQPHCTSDVPAFPLHLFSLGFGDKLQNKGSVFILAALSASFQRGPDPAVLYGMLQGTQTPNLSPQILHICCPTACSGAPEGTGGFGKLSLHLGTAVLHAPTCRNTNPVPAQHTWILFLALPLTSSSCFPPLGLSPLLLCHTTSISLPQRGPQAPSPLG